MRLIVAFSLFVLISTVSSSAFSQNEPVVDGGKYVLHTVAKKETIFNLCKTYNITLQELQAANPQLGGVLQAGSTVKIPVSRLTPETQKKEPSASQSSATEFYYHKVQKKQTLYSIAKQYGITANDVIRFNPEAANGLKIGEILKIPVNPKMADKPAILAESSKPTNVPGFSFHRVVADETIFGLEKQYGITDEEMLKLNPDLKNGLKIGMTLKIPEKQEIKAEPVAETKQVGSKYQVEKGETIFSIAARFGVDVSDLKKANPILFSRGLETGETILIPQRSTAGSTVAQPVEYKPVVSQVPVYQESVTSGNCLPQPNSFKKYKVALLLPLYLPAINKMNPDSTAISLTDSVKPSSLFSPIVFNNKPLAIGTDTTVVVSGTNIDPRATNFLEFYEGALLALDSMQRAGMNVELYVFDANNQTQVNNLLQMDKFLDMNLIIGPVYPELQGIVAGFAAKNRIPMISPLSSGGNFIQNNSWYFQVNSTRDYQIDQTARYIAEEFAHSNFFLLKPSIDSPDAAEARLAQLCRENLSRKSSGRFFHVYNFKLQGIDGIKPLLDPQGENVFLIPSDNEAQVSLAVSNLNELAEKYNIVLIGTAALPKMKSIQIESYHHIRLRYLSPYFIDYKKPLVRRFVSHYRNDFSGEPSQFSFQGFDVTFYFLNALNRYGQDFRNCVPTYFMELTQMSFNFRKVAPMGGCLNGSLFITSYERNYDILNYGIYRSRKAN